MLKKQTIIILTVIIFTVFIDLLLKQTEPVFECKNNKANVIVGTFLFNSVVVSNDIDREKGLSGKKEIFPNEGMLFVFNKEEVPKFWMKDMNFPIDIVWIDENKKIVGVEQDISPETYPNTFSPKSKIKYVLEVGANNISNINDLVGSSVLIGCE